MNHLKTVFDVYTSLPKEAKPKIFVTFVSRIFLVSLDLASLAFIGIAVSLLTSTTISKNSITGKAIYFLSQTGLENLYAVFATVAVAFVLLKSLCAILLNGYVFRSIAAVETRIAVEQFVKLGRAPIAFFSKWGKKEISGALLESMDYTYSKVVSAASVALGEIALILAMLIFLFFVNPALVACLLIYFGLVGFLMNILVASRNKAASIALTEASLQSTEAIHSVQENFKQIRTQASQAYFVQKFGPARLALAKSNALLSVTSVLPRYFTEIALMFGFALLIAQRSLLGSNSLSPLTISLFVTASVRIVASMLPLQGALGVLAQAKGSGRLATDILRDLSPVDTAFESQIAPNSAPARIVLSDVDYTYPGQSIKALKNVSIDIAPGEFVVIEGTSGGGKSTLVELVLGLRKPDSGLIRINELDPVSLLNFPKTGLGYVPQKSQIINATLRENLTFSDRHSSSTDAQAIRICEKVGLGDWFATLPKGLDTLIGELSRNLSGGQVQRIAIARALISDPFVLVLDESTSSLDKESEEMVLETLGRLKGSVTIIAVAHKGSMSRLADRTLTVRDGFVL